MAAHIFTGFGFGPIQAGLFVKEAFQSGNFSRIVAAEIDQELVNAVRANSGSYYVNVAKADGIEALKIDHVELLNPNVAEEREILLQVLAESTEIATCLPSVDFYDLEPVRNSTKEGNNTVQSGKISNGAGGSSSAASLIADGLKKSRAKATIIYTAENNNRAAEILQEAVTKKAGALSQERVQFLNTVIGKMSRVVMDPVEIAERKLAIIAPGLQRAFLVEEFNRILVTRMRISNFRPGIEVFIEKDDLLPFEEAKLFGHNAIHALLGFIAAVCGYSRMTELVDVPAIMQIARAAFLEESGAALIKKYAYLGDELFTEAGFRDYAEELLQRMTNPYLADTVARVSRDVVRKLGLNERIFGTMQLALEYGIEPKNISLGAAAGFAVLLREADENNLPGNLSFGDWRKLDDARIERVIRWLWTGQTCKYIPQIIKYVQNAQEHLKELTKEDCTD